MKIIKITWLETWLCMCSNLKKVSGFWGVVDMGWWASDGFITVWKRERDSGRWNLLDPSTTILRGQHMNHMNKNVAPPTIVKLVFTTHRKKNEDGKWKGRQRSTFKLGLFSAWQSIKRKTPQAQTLCPWMELVKGLVSFGADSGPKLSNLTRASRTDHAIVCYISQCLRKDSWMKHDLWIFRAHRSCSDRDNPSTR